MKILLIVPGAGDTFYCGNCFRDNLYAQALQNAGHEVSIMPLYLPLAEKLEQSNTPLFFPATTYYVAQKFFKNRPVPRFLRRILEAPFVLRLASHFSGTTSAKGMENMTLSMIKGDDKNFAMQIEKIIEWVENTERPDVIHLSTSMLIGIAKAIKNRLNILIACSLQDEEVWLDSLEEKHAREAWKAIGNNAKFVDKFIASSEFYKAVSFARIPEIQTIDVVYPGVNIDKYQSSEPPENPTIGFFYRANHENGLDILANAFVQLKTENSIPNLKLKIGGGYTRENHKFVSHIQSILKPFMSDVIWSEDYTLKEHPTFYKEISLICAPLRFEEGFGLYLAEAFAAGRPAVVPDTGSFREVVGDAGVLYAPNDSENLANALREILLDSVVYQGCSERAELLSRERYNDVVASKKLETIYSAIL